MSGARIGETAGDAYTRRYYRKLDRYSAALALIADVLMGVLGGKLKFKESLSGRLGDVLSHLYIASAMLKRYEDEGRPEADRPLLAWAFHNSAHKIEDALSARCATSRCARSAGCCGLGVPAGPPREAAVRPPGPPGRRTADVAERGARPPDRRRLHHARAETIPAAA